MYTFQLTLTLLMWRIWWAPTNASKWQMGFNSAFKGLTSGIHWQFTILYKTYHCPSSEKTKSVHQIQGAGTVLTHPVLNLHQHNLINGGTKIQNKNHKLILQIMTLFYKKIKKHNIIIRELIQWNTVNGFLYYYTTPKQLAKHVYLHNSLKKGKDFHLGYNTTPCGYIL